MPAAFLVWPVRAVLWLLLLCGGGSALYGQVVGGLGAGQGVPKAAEVSRLGGAAVSDDVDLFSGTLGLSYSFGDVATVTGLKFPISLRYSSAAVAPFDAPQNSGIPYGEGWSLDQGTIVVENMAYSRLPGELPQGCG